MSVRHVHRWKSASGRDYRINVPPQGPEETPEDFERRLRAAEARASAYDAGSDFVADLREKNSQSNMVEITNAALLDLMSQIDGVDSQMREIQRMETGQHKQNLLSRASLDKMRLTGQKAALRAYLTTQTQVTPFADESGEGLSFSVNESGEVAAPAMEGESSVH